jgi:hypothetical protein
MRSIHSCYGVIHRYAAQLLRQRSDCQHILAVKLALVFCQPQPVESFTTPWTPPQYRESRFEENLAKDCQLKIVASGR